MFRSLFVLLSLLLIGSVAVTAAPVQCQAVSQLSALESLVDGCYDTDKLYTNFTYDSDDVNSSSVFVIIGTSFPSPGIDQHTVTMSTPGGWTTPFSFGYTVTIYNPRAPLSITSAALDIGAPNIGGAPNASTVDKTLMDDMGGLHFLSASQGGADSVTGLLTQSLTITATGTPTNGTITSVTDTYFESLVPEPGTYALMGAGLMALGLLRRRS